MFVSVVVITKNNALTIGDCVTSLLDQTYPKEDYEIILVDGHSNDGTDEIFKKYANDNSHLRLFYESHGTMGYARNIGVRESKGDIVAFTDGDATVPDTWLEQIVHLFEDPQVTAVGGKDLLVSGGQSKKMMISWRKLRRAQGAKAIPCIKTVNFAIRREALLLCGGFDPMLSHWDEAEMLARLYYDQKVGGILFEPKLTVNHRHSMSFEIGTHVKRLFSKTVMGTATLVRKHMIKTAIANPTSSIGIAFNFIPFCLVSIPLLLLLFATVAYTWVFLLILSSYAIAMSSYAIFMYKSARHFALGVPILLTVDFVTRFFGTLVGLGRWVYDSFSTRRRGTEAETGL